MKFLVDANLPPGLATWLCEHAHESIHVSDQPGLTLDDRAVFEFARRNDYIIMTKDEDFATLATLVTDVPSGGHEELRENEWCCACRQPRWFREESPSA